MKKIFSLSIYITTIVIYSCHSRSIPQKSLINQESIDSRGNAMLLGKCTRKKIEEKPYGEWFNKNYMDYRVDSIVAGKLKGKLVGKNFMIFMGTWCGDSKREVPRMFKLLDYCGIKQDRIQLIMLNSYDSVYKQSPTHEERGLNIHRVPDLLVFEGKKEIGRIVESPVNSIEKDLSAILNEEKYEPNYQIVSFLIILFKEKSLEDIHTNLPSTALSLKTLMSNIAELRSYGHVLMTANEFDKAAIAFKLNALLYPDNPAVYDNLGEYYLKTGNKILAKENYQKSLQLQPENENAKKMLEQL